MEFEIGDKVRITGRDLVGYVVDKAIDQETCAVFYTIESESEIKLEDSNDPNVYPALHPLIDCSPDEMEPI